MASFTKEFLSGSTNGRPIKVVATATPGTLIHTADATATDEVYIYAVSTTGADVDLTIEFGGVTSPDDHITVKVKKEAGLLLVVPGSPLTNSLVVRAFAGSANALNIVGWVNRIA
jgi:hypothetical protein